MAKTIIMISFIRCHNEWRSAVTLPTQRLGQKRQRPKWSTVPESRRRALRVQCIAEGLVLQALEFGEAMYVHIEFVLSSYLNSSVSGTPKSRIWP